MSPSLAKSALLLCASLLGSASAAPAVGKQQPAPGSANQAFLINYNFETVSSTLGQLPLSDHPINDYALLHFKTLLINQTQPSLGVPCHTAPACSVFTLSSDLLEGLLTPGQNPVSIDGPAYITAAYQYSPITFFDPYAWYFGCVTADANGAAALAMSCEITATGVNSAGKTVYSQVFTFNPPAENLLQAPMTLGYFDQGWSGLQVQTLYLSVTNNATTAGIFDNFLATVYGPQNAAVLVDF